MIAVEHDPYEDTVTDYFNRTMRMKSGKYNSDDALISFLYILGRDHLPLGVIEEIMRKDVEAVAGEVMYTNGWLAEWAEDVAARIYQMNSRNKQAKARDEEKEADEYLSTISI